jgi:small subunit ribosomal protein S35
MTSTAHGELEQHREMREYARIMAWDMPLLYSMFDVHHLHPNLSSEQRANTS